MSVSMDIRPGRRGPIDIHTGNMLDPVQMGGIIIEGKDDYNELENKPSINGVPLEGDLSSEDLHIEGGPGGKSYAFAEGDVDGAIQVTEQGKQAQNVPVHGLKGHCFAEALTEEEILTILDHEDNEAEDEAE